MVNRRTAAASCFAVWATVSAYLACIGPVDFTGKMCDDGACPAPWRCFGGICVIDASPDAPPYAAQVLADQPLLYMRFDEDAGPTAFDQSGHGFGGTYSDSGVTYGVGGAIASDPNGAVALSGLGGVGVAMGPGLDFSGASPFTVEVWVNQTKSLGNAFVIDHADHANHRAGWDFLFGGTTPDAGPSLERRNGNDASTTGGSVAASATPLSQGQYHHVVATCNGAELVLYVDGQVAAINGIVSSIPDTGVPWIIGNIAGGSGGNGLAGSLDELAIYDHALDGGTVAAHFAAAQ